MKGHILTFLLALCVAPTALAIPAQAAKTGFSDVPDHAYYTEPVAWAVEREITKGTSDTTFSPNQTCTIAQITVFLWRACGAPELDCTCTSNPFSDVKTSQYYYQAALWAYENGITLPALSSGYEAGKFYGNLDCARSVVVQYLWKLQGSPDVTVHSFQDVNASTKMGRAVSWAVEHGITNGTTDTTFSPDKVCTRAQIVTFLYRAAQAGQLRSKFYSVTLDGNGGTVALTVDGAAPQSQIPFTVTAAGQSTDKSADQSQGTYYMISCVTVSREGYVFQGWYTEKTGGAKVTASTKVTKTSPHTLFAHWASDSASSSGRSFEVTLDGNGGLLTLAVDGAAAQAQIPFTVTPGDASRGIYYLISHVTVIWEKHEFLGWFTAKEGGTKVTADTKADPSVPALYAHWKPNS